MQTYIEHQGLELVLHFVAEFDYERDLFLAFAAEFQQLHGELHRDPATDTLYLAIRKDTK